LKGDDDFFSSDLSDGRLKEIWQHPTWKDIPVLVLYGREDQYTPNFVDKVSMIQRWEKFYEAHGKNHAQICSHFELLDHANHEIVDLRLRLNYLRS